MINTARSFRIFEPSHLQVRINLSLPNPDPEGIGRIKVPVFTWLLVNKETVKQMAWAKEVMQKEHIQAQVRALQEKRAKRAEWEQLCFSNQVEEFMKQRAQPALRF